MDRPAASPGSARSSTFQNGGLSELAGLVLFGAAALADHLLAARHFSLAVVYVLPLLALAWLAGWRIAAVSTLIAAAINFGIDASLSDRLANAATVHLVNIAIFALCLPLERGVGTLRLMLDFSRRGQAWKAAIHTARLGERVVLVPAWRRDEAAASARPSDVHVLLDPGQAFGTGAHPTTQLCVALLEQYVRPGDRLLDLGCGSGILSVAALKLGAGSVLATDIKPEAVRATGANAQLNEVSSRLDVRLGSLENLLGSLAGADATRYNVTVANILPDVIVGGLKAGVARTLAPQGLLIISGFKTDIESRMGVYLDEAGLQIVDRRETEGWLALATRLKAG